MTTKEEIASKGQSPRFPPAPRLRRAGARRPNRKVFGVKKSVGDSAFWEKKIFAFEILGNEC